MNIQVGELKKLILAVILCEAFGGKLVVVDVQPEYASRIRSDARRHTRRYRLGGARIVEQQHQNLAG